jgi:uncharacterized protein (TIGR02118 family)
MADAKLVVLYPQPTDAAKFDRDYFDDHVPLVVGKSKGIVSHVAVTKILGAADGQRPPYYLMFEAYFPSDEVMKTFLGSADLQEVAAHAVSISSGGAPIVLVSEETRQTL